METGSGHGIASFEDPRAAGAEFGYPFVLKPTISWTGESADRISPVEVIDEAEAADATKRFLATGAGVPAQQWASGRREGVTLFVANGEVIATCAHLAVRRWCGRASRFLDELLDAAVQLVTVSA